jgi:hypothetical protein
VGLPQNRGQLIKVDLGYVTRQYRRLPEHLHGMTGDIIASESAPGGKLRVGMIAITVLGGVAEPVARLTAPLRWFAWRPRYRKVALQMHRLRSATLIEGKTDRRGTESHRCERPQGCERRDKVAAVSHRH